MTIEYLLLCLLICKYRDQLGWQQKDEPLTDYQSEMLDALICEAPKPARHLRLVK